LLRLPVPGSCGSRYGTTSSARAGHDCPGATRCKSCCRSWLSRDPGPRPCSRQQAGTPRPRSRAAAAAARLPHRPCRARHRPARVQALRRERPERHEPAMVTRDGPPPGPVVPAGDDPVSAPHSQARLARPQRRPGPVATRTRSCCDAARRPVVRRLW
jgi:hypothetical protein